VRPPISGVAVSFCAFRASAPSPAARLVVVFAFRPRFSFAGWWWPVCLTATNTCGSPSTTKKKLKRLVQKGFSVWAFVERVGELPRDCYGTTAINKKHERTWARFELATCHHGYHDAATSQHSVGVATKCPESKTTW